MSVAEHISPQLCRPPQRWRRCGKAGNAGKAGAIFERIAADRRYAIGDGYIAAYSSRNLYNSGFRLVVQYPVLACVAGIVRVYRYAGKAGAIGERIAADRRYAIGDGYVGKAGATRERIAADRRYACGDDYAGKIGAILKNIIPNVFLECYRQIIGGKVSPSSCNSIVINNYVPEAIANVEHVGADRRYAVGDGYAGKAAATDERPAADRRYAIGDGYAGKAGAIVERAAADRCYAIGDGYAGKVAAIVEHIVADRRYAFREGYAGKSCV